MAEEIKNKKTREEAAERQRQKDLEMLRVSYHMYEDAKKECAKKTKEKRDKNGNKIYSDDFTEQTIEMMDTMQDDIKEQYIKLGGNPDNIVQRPKTCKVNKTLLKGVLDTVNAREEMSELIRQNQEKAKKVAEMTAPKEEEHIYYEEETPAEQPTLKEPTIAEQMKQMKEEKAVETSFNETRMQNGKYDVIPLPSKGQCYPNKKDEIPVAFMTAYDENLIMSPNLYKNGLFLDYLLRSKVMSNEIDPDDMVQGDRDAIVLWLRATSYGTDYPITVTDKDGHTFDTTIDLSEIKYKDFNLKGDAYGYFTYTLPVSGDVIKFKFLSYKENKMLQKLSEEDNSKIKKGNLANIIESVGEYIDNDENLKRELKIKLTTAVGSLQEYYDSIEEDDDTLVLHAITNHLEMSIMAINDITDREYIHDYVKNMSVRDSSALRTYIYENEPGVNFNIEVKRPESLGGGSETTFLRLDQFLFLNRA